MRVITLTIFLCSIFLIARTNPSYSESADSASPWREEAIFYCSEFSDALSIAENEEESLMFNETDEEYFERIFPLIRADANRCTVDILTWKKEKILCYWNGVTLSNPRTYGRKYIVKIEARSHPAPLYAIFTDVHTLFKDHDAGFLHCSS